MQFVDEFKKFLVGKKKASGVLRRDTNCYCIEGAMCEFYRRKTGQGKWLRRKGAWAFVLDGREEDSIAPRKVLNYFEIYDHVYHKNDGNRKNLVGVLKSIL